MKICKTPWRPTPLHPPKSSFLRTTVENPAPQKLSTKPPTNSPQKLTQDFLTSMNQSRLNCCPASPEKSSCKRTSTQTASVQQTVTIVLNFHLPVKPQTLQIRLKIIGRRRTKDHHVKVKRHKNVGNKTTNVKAKSPCPKTQIDQKSHSPTGADENCQAM